MHDVDSFDAAPFEYAARQLGQSLKRPPWRREPQFMKAHSLRSFLAVGTLACSSVLAQTKPTVHAVVDLGHQFTFYADAAGNPVLARKPVGKGTLVVGARGLAGSNPNAKDNINAAWWHPLLVRTAAGKTSDPRSLSMAAGWNN